MEDELVLKSGRINRRELARRVTVAEGGKRNLNIADVTEVVRLVIEILARYPEVVRATLEAERMKGYRKTRKVLKAARA